MEGADESTESCQPHSGTILGCEAAAESVSQPNEWYEWSISSIVTLWRDFAITFQQQFEF